MWFWGDGIGGWWMIFGAIWMILFWGGLILLIVWAVKKLSERGGGGGGAGKSALDIAKERYARGEITKEQFEALKKDLM